MTLTTSSIFLKTLSDAGITHAFVNWGSDHPALLEELERQRVRLGGSTRPAIVTCPNEMVALSAAHGYALVTGKPAVVIVHVDVGTQALAGAIHNADRGRVPVLIYAGASPFSDEGELKGSRNEYIHWLQDIPDQPAIVRQYMRFTTQIHSAANTGPVVMRGLQIASSNPKGPVYLWTRRETSEEDVVQKLFSQSLDLGRWRPSLPVTIPRAAAKAIAGALLSAKKPLIVTSYLGREPSAVSLLVSLSEMLAIPVFQSCPSTLSFPHTHPHHVGLSFGHGECRVLHDADVILVLDSDIPWIPMHNRPSPDARIFHIDVDIFKRGMGYFHIDAERSWEADGTLALETLLEEITRLIYSVKKDPVENRRKELISRHTDYIRSLDLIEQTWHEDGSFTVPNILGILRYSVPNRTLFLNESVTNLPTVWMHLRPTRPGSIYTSGASSLGWGLGAAIGASLAQVAQGGQPREWTEENEFVCLIVGDGSFLFGVPSAAYWIARKYGTPFLTIVLNNGGWKAPKMSMLGVYPDGMGSLVSGQQLSTGFGPDPPNYSAIATAAGGAWGVKVSRASELKDAVPEAIRVVKEEKRCAVVDCVIEGF